MALFRGRPLAVSRRRVIIKSPLTEGVRPLLSGGAYNFARWRLNNRKSFSRNVLRDAPALAPPRRNSSRRRFFFQGCRICFSGCPSSRRTPPSGVFCFLDAPPSNRDEFQRSKSLTILTVPPNTPRLPVYSPLSRLKFGGKAGKIRSAALDKPRQYAKIKKNLPSARNLGALSPPRLAVDRSSRRAAFPNVFGSVSRRLKMKRL